MMSPTTLCPSSSPLLLIFGNGFNLQMEIVAYDD
jgi:hypothetical protein